MKAGFEGRKRRPFNILKRHRSYSRPQIESPSYHDCSVELTPHFETTFVLIFVRFQIPVASRGGSLLISTSSSGPAFVWGLHEEALLSLEIVRGLKEFIFTYIHMPIHQLYLSLVAAEPESSYLGRWVGNAKCLHHLVGRQDSVALRVRHRHIAAVMRRQGIRGGNFDLIDDGFLGQQRQRKAFLLEV